jgi:hypothetical protein
MIRPDQLLKVYVPERLPQIASSLRIVTPLPPLQGITMRKFRHPFLAAC